ncbi:MAG TPA: thioesterase family protein [Candidatus Thermoplasmatota archaeon]|nr:thioesterase family protein [Candidatus Thermoplasmatota archaeon]
MTDAWPFSVEVPIRFRDCDPMRHLNNAVVATYLEIARTDYYWSRRGIDSLDAMDFILARVEIDFKSQATFGETLVVRLRPSSVGTSSFVLDYEVREARTQRPVAAAKTVQVCYDYASGRKTPVPATLRAALIADGATLREAPAA